MGEESKKIIELANECIKLVTPRPEKIRDTKYQEEIAVISNVKAIIQESDDISTTTLIHLVNTLRYFMRLYNRGANQDGEIDDLFSELGEDLRRVKEKEIRQQWIQLIGLEKVRMLEKDYQIKYSQKTKAVYKTNEIEVNFLETDNKQDTVIFFSLCYNFDDKKFITEDCIKGGYCDTYQQVKEHNLSEKDKIIGNNFQFVYLP